MSRRSSSTKLISMRSFKYFEKIPILGKCLSLILSTLKITCLHYFQIPMSHVSCLMSNVKSPTSSWSWRSWQYLVYWSLTLKQLHLVLLWYKNFFKTIPLLFVFHFELWIISFPSILTNETETALLKVRVTFLHPYFVVLCRNNLWPQTRSKY